MKAKFLSITIAGLVLIQTANAQLSQQRYRNIGEEWQTKFLLLEYRLSDGKGWSEMSDLDKGIFLDFADSFGNLKKKNEDLETRVITNNDEMDKRKKETQRLANAVSKNLHDNYLSQPLSSISSQYLVMMKKDLEGYKKYIPIKDTVTKCIDEINNVLEWVKVYDDIETALQQIYNKARSEQLLKKAETICSKMKNRNSNEKNVILKKNYEKQYKEFNEKKILLECYSTSLMLFQDLINKVNNDKTIKKNRESNDNPLAPIDILEKFKKIWTELDNKKDHYAGRTKGENFRVFIQKNPYLADKYEQYYQGIIFNPLEQNDILEKQILSIKVN